MMSSKVEAQGLTLPVAENKTGYYGVYLGYPDKCGGVAR